MGNSALELPIYFKNYAIFEVLHRFKSIVIPVKYSSKVVAIIPIKNTTTRFSLKGIVAIRIMSCAKRETISLSMHSPQKIYTISILISSIILLSLNL